MVNSLLRRRSTCRITSRTSRIATVDVGGGRILLFGLDDIGSRQEILRPRVTEVGVFNFSGQLSNRARSFVAICVTSTAYAHAQKFLERACCGTLVETARNWERKSSNSRLGISAICFEVGNSEDVTAARKPESALTLSSRTALCSPARSPHARAWRGGFAFSPQMSEAKRKITSASTYA